MAAWLVVTAVIPNREAFLACGYAQLSAQLLEAAGGKYVVRAPGAQVLEGTGTEGASVIISEWPSREAALTFWHSADYQAAKKLREGLADISVVVVGT